MRCKKDARTGSRKLPRPKQPSDGLPISMDGRRRPVDVDERGRWGLVRFCLVVMGGGGCGSGWCVGEVVGGWCGSVWWLWAAGGVGLVGVWGRLLGLDGFCFDECGRQGARCPRRRNGESIPNRTCPNPANPLVKPIPCPPDPGKNAKNTAPRSASRARPPPPPPDVRTRLVSTRQGRVRKMIPVSVCGACRPEVLWLLHYPASVRQGQYPCGRIRRIFLSFP